MYIYCIYIYAHTFFFWHTEQLLPTAQTSYGHKKEMRKKNLKKRNRHGNQHRLKVSKITRQFFLKRKRVSKVTNSHRLVTNLSTAAIFPLLAKQQPSHVSYNQYFHQRKACATDTKLQCIQIYVFTNGRDNTTGITPRIANKQVHQAIIFPLS